ncbi:MAG: hypothetical protein ACO3G9_07085, partial [Chthoniobacterales bacterium]
IWQQIAEQGPLSLEDRQAQAEAAMRFGGQASRMRRWSDALNLGRLRLSIIDMRVISSGIAQIC